MKQRNILTLILLLAALTLAAQSNYSPCYTNNMSKGNTAFSQGKYSEARTYYVNAKQCAGGNPTEAQKKINACDAKIKAQKEAAEAKRRAEAEAAERRRIEEEAKRKAEAEARGEFTVNGVTFKMVYVQGGTFTMGCTSEQGSCDDEEKPVHMVTVSGFWMGETEVTVGLFRTFINETGYRTDAEKEGWAWRWMQVDGEWKWNKVDGLYWIHDKNGNARIGVEDNQPVLYVSWNDTKAFCEWLKKKTGKNFRMPTEAEWEYAARGGNKSRGYKYAGSNTIGDVAWYVNNSGGSTHPVKAKQANELGLYDMTGNVWEWCYDWMGNYGSSSQTNPTGSSSGSYRVLRGGCWLNDAGSCRVSFRGCNDPGYRCFIIGFRLVLVP